MATYNEAKAAKLEARKEFPDAAIGIQYHTDSKEFGLVVEFQHTEPPAEVLELKEFKGVPLRVEYIGRVVKRELN